MTPFTIPEPPYTIEGVMQELAQQFEPGEAPPARVGSSGPPDHERSLLEWLDKTRRVTPTYRIKSHRPFLGRLIDPIKRFLHWGSRPYVDLLAGNQETFNLAALEALRHALARVRGLEYAAARLESLNVEQARVSRVIAENLNEFSRHQTGINRRIDGKLDDFIVRQEGEHGDQRRLNEALLQTGRELKARHDLEPFYQDLPKEKRLELMDRLRGTFGEIWGRHHAHLEHFRRRPGRILDLGCGRGEFLVMLRGEGIESWGCEIDPMMVAEARERGVHVLEADALTTLRSVEPASLGGVFASQVIEHFFPGDLLLCIKLAKEKLAPGGVIVLETLNPQSLAVLAKSYYKDLDHKRAIDPDYLALLLEAAGFVNVRSGRSMPFGERERLGDLPPAERLGLSTETHRTLQEMIDKLNALLWAEQDCYVVGESPPIAPREGLETRAEAVARAPTG